MKTIRRIAAAVVSFTLAATMIGCTPTIGAGTENALSINGYDVRSGIFLYYTMQAYSEAVSELTGSDGTAPDLKTVKSSRIEDLEAEDWIQDKATKYCEDYATIQQEFDRLELTLTDDALDQIDQMAEYYFNMNENYAENGITQETIRDIAASTFKEEVIFKHYYDLGGEKSCTEDELKDYFDDNFARVKYFTIKMTDDEGNALDDDKKRELRKKAELYVKQINSKSSAEDKLAEFDVANNDYNEYLDSLTTTAEGEESADTEDTTTTAVSTDEESAETTTDINSESEESGETTETTEISEETDEESEETTEVSDEESDEESEDEENEDSAETTTAVSTESDEEETTTTADPYANDRLIQKKTTAAESEEKSSETTVAETESEKQDKAFNDHLFEMEFGKAEVYDYSDDEIYVVIRGDLRERMTEDDLWSEDYVEQLLQMRFYDEFTESMEKLAKESEVNKNNRAYNRYAPFKLTLEKEA